MPRRRGPTERIPTHRGEGAPARVQAPEQEPMGAAADPHNPEPVTTESPVRAAPRTVPVQVSVQDTDEPELESTLGTVAHELRSPLVSILGFARLLERDCADALGDRGRHYLRRIEEGGRRMEGLLVDLLALARCHGVPGARAGADLREVAQEVAASLGPRFAERGVELHMPNHSLRAPCEPTALRQILCNLIGNALDHMGAPPNPRIEVEWSRRSGGVELVVSDNGHGVPPADRERIFRLFERGHPSPGGGTSGTGIGLAIVRRIVEAHGGRAGVDERPGGGAHFRVFLPEDTA